MKICISATVTDAHDGLTRLLADVARFGYQVDKVRLSGRRVELRFPADSNQTHSLRASLARHPTIVSLSARATH